MGIVRECLRGGFQRAVPHQFLLSETSEIARRSQDWGHGWDRLETPSVNVLITKLLNLNPLFWDMDCLLTLWPLLIPCSLGNGCCMFVFIKRNFLYNSLYTLTERSLKHLCSIRAWVPLSVCLSLSLSLSLSLPPVLSFSFLLSTPDHQVLVH